MSNAFQDRLNKSRQKLTGASAPVYGNIVLQPTEFGEKTITGTVLSGRSAGSVISVEYAGTLGQKDYTKKGGRSAVNMEKGGTLRVERVEKKDDNTYKARWIKTLHAKPGDHDRVIPDAVCGLVTIPARSEDDAPTMRINQLMMDSEALVTSVDEMEKAIADAFASEGGVILFGVKDGNVIQSPYALGGTKADNGDWVANDAAERAKDVMASLSDVMDIVEDVLADGGFSVVPTRSYLVGSDTALNVEREIEEAAEKGGEARISTVDPKTWNTPTQGNRLALALNRQEGSGKDRAPVFSKEATEKFTAAFEAWADKSEVSAFKSGGWRALSNETIDKFFAAQGVDVASHPTRGWPTQALVEKRREGADRGIIIKAFSLSPQADPYPAVKACEDIRKAYRDEIVDAVQSVLEGLRLEAGAKADVKAADVAEVDDKAPEELPEDDDTLDILFSGTDLDN